MMKLKVIYSIIYCIFGLITGFFISLFFLIITVGLSSQLISEQNIISLWYKVLLGASFVIPFTFIIILEIKRGIKAVQELAGLESKAKVKKAKFNLALSFVALIVFAGFVHFLSTIYQNRIIRIKSNYQLLYSSLKKISSLDAQQSVDSLVVNVEIPGVTNDQYELTVQLISDSYVKGKLFEFIQKVPLVLPKQSFNFVISFEGLSRAYRQELGNYLPVVARQFDIDEKIIIKATLKLIETNDYSASHIEKMNIPEDEKYGIARFMFSCLNEECRIVQEEKYLKEEGIR